MITLRPYQMAGVEEIRDAFRRGKRAPLYVLPTGGGKSVVLSYVGKSAAEKGRRVTVIVHRRELIDQLSNSLDMVGCQHGLIAAGYAESPHEQVQLASIDTLVRRIAKDPRRYYADLFIQDEAHHLILGNKWGAVAQAYPRARYLGVTATPTRLSGEGLGAGAGGIFDELIIGPSVAELISVDALVHPEVYGAREHIDTAGLSMRGGDYVASEVAARLDNNAITGDAIEHYKRICPGARAIVFAANREHSKHVAAAFRAAGVPAAHVDSETPDDERRQAIRDFRAGRLLVLCNVNLFGEGFDVPAVEAVIMLRLTASLTNYLQWCGRAMRPADGKTRGVILDHVDNWRRHGMPWWDREWSLDGEDKKKRAKRAAEIETRVSQCPTCFRPHETAPRCPYCGHQYAPKLALPKERDGELAQVTDEAAETVRQKLGIKQGRARTLQQLLAMGMSRGRAEHILAAREEKDRLRDELRELWKRWRERTGKPAPAAWGVPTERALLDLKPKQLRERIELAREALDQLAENDWSRWAASGE